MSVLNNLSFFRIRNPQAFAHQHAMLNPASNRLPLCFPLVDTNPFRHGSEPVAAPPPYTLPPAAVGSKPAPACYDHPTAHHGYVHHHRNQLVAGHGQPRRAQLYQCGQLSLVRKEIIFDTTLSLSRNVVFCFVFLMIWECFCSSPQTLMSGSNPMLGPGLNLSGILPSAGLMPTMQSAAQTGKKTLALCVLNYYFYHLLIFICFQTTGNTSNNL